MNLYDNGNGDDGSWNTWRKHVLLEIKRLNSNLEKTEERSTEHILKVSTEISKLKVWVALCAIVLGTTAGAVLKEVISKW